LQAATSEPAGNYFAAIGGQIEIVHADNFGNHLIVRFAGRSSGRVLLLGHTDTVWPAGEIARRPFKIDAGRASGPGVFDMKAGEIVRPINGESAIRDFDVLRIVSRVADADESIRDTMVFDYR